MNKKKKYYLIVITILILVLPYLKLRFGSLPIYFLDIVMLVSVYKFKSRVQKSSKFNKLLFFYVLFSFFSFLVELLVYNNYITIYFFMRWILSYLTFMVVKELLDNIYSIKIVLKTIIIAATINSILSISYSLPQTRSYVKPLFSNDNIFPSRSRVQDRFEADDESQRGVTLAGGSTTTPLIIIPGICVLLFLYGRSKFIKISSIVSVLLIILMISGSLITLSRSVILTFCLYLLFLFFKSSLKLKRIIFLAIFFLVIGVNYSGILEKIDYSRLEDTVSMVETNKIGYSEEERVNAYIRPFEHLIKYPFSIIMGHGLSPEKMDNKYVLFDGDIKGKHGFPGAIIYDRGFIAFIIMSFFLVSFYKKIRKKEYYEHFYFLNLLLLINLIVPILSEHYLFDNIVGSYQLFFLLAVILSLKKIKINYES
jgi:hypothetical protein